MTPFLRKFGKYNEAKGTYTLPKQLASLMNSLPLIGKFTGTVIVGPIIEKIGHRWTMVFTCCVQVIGPISTLSTQAAYRRIQTC